MPRTPETEINPTREDLKTRFGTMQEQAIKAAKIAYDTRGTVLFRPEADTATQLTKPELAAAGNILIFDPKRKPRRSRIGS